MEPQVENVKDNVISRMYYDLAGHGSVKKTYTQAHRRNSTITEADVKD